MAGGATFSCESCGKQYPWKPELAGKKARCKCGAVLSVPAQPQAARAAARTPVAVAAAPVEESQGYRCPACKGDLTPGTAVCISCGYDLRTGEYVGTQVDTGEEEAEAVPAPKKKKKKKAAVAAGMSQPSATNWVGVSKSNREKAAEQEADKSRTMKQVIIALVLCVVVVGVIFGGKFAFKKAGGKGAQASNLPGDDAEAMRMLQNDEPIEAKEFIEAHQSRQLGTQWTRSKSLAKIQQWYDMGVVKVWAFNGLISRHVVFELPQDPAKRSAILEWTSWFEDESGQKKIKDVGQKYLIIMPP